MSGTGCEHGPDRYICARCTRNGQARTFERTEQGREKFREHLAQGHRVQQRPSWRYRR